MEIKFALAVAPFLVIASTARLSADESPRASKLFDKNNLVAWCIVPFDDQNRSPEDRAQMLEELGIKKFAYDYRAQHVPTWDAEIEALKKHGIELTAWWFPQSLNPEAKRVLDLLKRHNIKTQLWVTGISLPTNSEEEQRARVKSEVERVRPIAEAAAEIGCTVGLYNHGSWFGEPENQIEVIKALNMPNVGIVYNLHHGHDHLDRLPQLLETMKPYLYCVNLNGMVTDGDKKGQKIVPLGSGERDLEVLKTIRDSGYKGPIGILNHTMENAEHRLQDNLAGLAWLSPQLDGQPAGEKPIPRTWKSPK